MEAIHAQAVRLRNKSCAAGGVLLLEELEACGRLALACARIEQAMRAPLKGGELKKLSPEELRAKIAEIEAAKAAREARS